jgi:hypothetical protein
VANSRFAAKDSPEYHWRKADGVSATHNENMHQRETTADLAARMPRVAPLRTLAPCDPKWLAGNAAEIFRRLEQASGGSIS